MLGLLFNRFTLYAAIAALAFAGAYSYKNSLIQRGYDKAVAEFQEAENTQLRELIRENSRLVGVVEKLNAKAKQQEKDIAAFRARQRAHADELRTKEADYQRRLAAASAEAVRQHAKELDGYLGRCTEDVERFATEAAQCSGVAWTLKDFIDELP